MTVRTLSGATVTLVGRGANYFDGDKIIPSFVDAEGTQFFIVDDPDDLDSVPCINNGIFSLVDDGVLPFTVTAANAILVNDPTTVENSTSALVFAKRCGIDVSLEGLRLYESDAGTSYPLANTPLACINSVVQLSGSGIDNTWAVYVEDGWGTGDAGCVDCNFEPVLDFEGQTINAVFAGTSTAISSRRKEHNAWVFVLAGVPEVVFTNG